MPWGDGRTSTTAGKAFRRTVLERDHTCRCTGCKHHTGPCPAPATEADHILNHAAGGTDDPHTNGQGLCRDCHTAKTTREAAAARTARRNQRLRPVQPHPSLKRAPQSP